MRAPLVRLLGRSCFTFFGAAALAIAAHAAPPADAPAGTTGLCKDGSYSASAGKRGACRGHKGVKEWYAADEATVTPGGPKSTSSSTTAAPAPAVSTTTAPAPSPTTTSTVPSAMPAPARSTTTSTATSKSGSSMSQPAAGGGPGMVWVNSDSKVYHCSGTRWYGKSKQGSYMSEAEAKTQGNRPSHGKACAA